MNITEVFELATWSDRLSQLKQVLKTDRKKEDNISYYGGNHPILTDADRQDINVTLQKKNAAGVLVDDKTVTVTKTKKILNYPVQLIGTLASFVFGNPPELILNNKSTEGDKISVAFQRIKNIWKYESRLDEHNKKLLRTVSVETNAAELFFNDNPEEPKKGKIKVMLLSQENGDQFWPFFNDTRDLEAFTRRYTKKLVEGGTVKEKTFEEIWTAEKFILIDVSDSKINEETVLEKPNPYKKIPVVYYDQVLPEWWKVLNLISIMEKKESQLSDVNTRVGHAAVKISGTLVNMPDATADVKVYEVKPGVGTDGKSVPGDVSYLESQTAPESVSLELKRTEEEIYKFSNIPDIYKIFEEAGKEASGEALRLRLFPINIIIDEKKEIYSPGLDRRISILKRMLANINGDNTFEELDITVQFKDYIPEDIKTTIDNLLTANGNKPIISQRKSVGMLMFNKNPEEEYQVIQDEESSEKTSGGSLNL